MNNSIDNIIMNLQGNCPNCQTVLTFKQAALLAKENNITEDAVMCHNCHKAYMVNLTLSEMTLLDEIEVKNIQPDKMHSNQQNIMPEENQKSNEDDESVFSVLFYKKDAQINKHRISKTKTISILLFILIYIILTIILISDPVILHDQTSIFLAMVASLIITLITVMPVFLVGYLISYLIDSKIKKNQTETNNQKIQDNSDRDYKNN